MNVDEDPLEAQRNRLMGLAYRMLGSVADAEDVMQDAYQRIHERSVSELTPAFLTRVVSNLCVDRLRAEKVRRRHYEGPWLPEPLPAADAPADIAELGEDLSFGFLLLLERLTPAERVVFVLREAFDYSFDEIGELLGVTAAACRKRFSRARAHLAGADWPDPEPVAAQKSMLERLMKMVAEGNVDALVGELCDDAVLITDGGGVVNAAIRPVLDPARIARVLVHVAHRSMAEAPFDYRMINVNGGWGLVVLQHGRPQSCVTIGLRNGRVHRLYIVRNPAKLAGLGSV